MTAQARERDNTIRLLRLYTSMRDTIEVALRAGLTEDDAKLALNAALDAYYGRG